MGVSALKPADTYGTKAYSHPAASQYIQLISVSLASADKAAAEVRSGSFFGAELPATATRDS